MYRCKGFMPLKLKTSMTSFDVAAVVAELRGFQGSRLVNIYDAPGKGFLFKYKSTAGAWLLYVKPGERVHSTGYEYAEKKTPSPLVMGLRKYIREGFLANVYQYGFDRIIFFEIRVNEDLYKLVAEVLPRGVMVLLDGRNVIVQASEYREMRDRVLKRGVVYEPPPQTSLHPEQLDASLLADRLKSVGGSVASVLPRVLGYPGEVVEEVLARLGLDTGTDVQTLESSTIDSLVKGFKELYSESLAGRGFIVYDSTGKPLTVVPFKPIGVAERYGLVFREYTVFSQALDKYFVEELKLVIGREETEAVDAERKKLLASLENAREKLGKLREKLEATRRLVELIGENMGLVYEAYNCARELRERSGWDSIPGNCPGVVDVKPGEGKIVASIRGELVELDIRRDPSQLLVELSRSMGELEAKIRRGEEAVKSIEEKLKQVETVMVQKSKSARALIRKRDWYERYHWLITSNGFLAVGGMDASQNESIVRKYLNEKRIFMHADIHGAPAVVFFAEGRTPPETDLREAALLTAAYSKAWKTGLGVVDVYWVWGDSVSKSAPAGEYLAHGAFMVYGRKNYLNNIELRLGIGIGVEDEYPVVVIGPVDLVRKRSIVYAVLIPGDEDPSKLATRLRRVFIKKAGEEYGWLVEALKVDEIRARIPGRSRAVHVGRGAGEEEPKPLRVLPGLS